MEGDKFIFFIYKLEIKDTPFYYIGSTNDLHVRYSRHKQRCYCINDRGYNMPLYKKIRELGITKKTFNKNVLKSEIKILEFVNDINIDKVKEAENSFISLENIYCLNGNKAYTELKGIEYQKQWRNDNKEEYKTYQKKWHNDNREEHLKQMKQWQKNNKNKFNCECCSYNTYNKTDYNKHLNRKKHIQTQNNTTNNYNNCNITINNTQPPNK